MYPHRVRTRLLAALLLVAVSACSSMPKRPESTSVIVGAQAAQAPEEPSEEAVLVAKAAQVYIGIPYRYGGDTPKGFDCSGLVYYTHRLAGMEVPRTAAEQSEAARPVQLDALLPGDVIFFRNDGSKDRTIDHVGIYVGQGRFVHAPSKGVRVVTMAYVDDPLYHRRMSGAGRFW